MANIFTKIGNFFRNARLGSAIDDDDLDKIRKIIDKHPEVVKTKTLHEITPLHYAVERDRRDAAAIILSAGADPNAKDNKGKTPLHYAARKGNIDIALLLFQRKAKPNLKDKAGITPIFEAVLFGGVDMVNFLIDNRADVNFDAGEGSTPLHLALFKKKQEEAAALIKRGADVNRRGSGGFYPIHLAVMNGDEATVKLLISKEADVNVILEEFQWSPLHFAVSDVSKSNREIIEILIKAGCNPNFKDKDGHSPLSISLEKGRLGTVKMLGENNKDNNPLKKKQS